MNELVVLEKKPIIPIIPTKWDYDQSVKKVKGFLYKWKNMDKTIATELWVAREVLSAQGQRTDLGANAPKLTWHTYCKDIGINKSTVNRWLVRYFLDDKQKALPDRRIIKPEDLTINIKHGDFRRLIKDIPDNSIDLILTDPPYAKEHLPLWAPLASESVRVLKPSGFFVAYSGQTNLPDKISALSAHLSYYWLGMLYHKGSVAQRFEINMFNRAKPILFYYKPPLKKQEKWIDDVLISEQADKDMHEWGQNIEPLKKLIDCFSNINDTVLDPMFGGGATIEACMEVKRNVVGFEIEKKQYDKIRQRIK